MRHVVSAELEEISNMMHRRQWRLVTLIGMFGPALQGVRRGVPWQYLAAFELESC